MITIHFSRPANTACAPSFDGFGGDFHAQCADPYFAIARQMTDAGTPDGPAVFVDERGMACLTVKSLHSCARRYAARQEKLRVLNTKKTNVTS